MYEQHELFRFMLERITETGNINGLKEPQAFGRWFLEMYYQKPEQILIPDGSGDGKVDVFFKTSDDENVTFHILNTKFTKKYKEPAPPAFYDEITRFWNAFNNKPSQAGYLKTVREELRSRYRTLFERFDAGRAKLAFVTNHKRNDRQYEAVRKYEMDIFHLEDLVQFMADHIEDAMPKTPTMLLTGINTVLSPETVDTEVPTSIVFARVTDLIAYMKKDPLDLLFARNVRLWLGDKGVNSEIRKTFKSDPKEFAYSNNGITMLCETHRHDPGPKELRITNPRVVNGSQTLHSVRDVDHPNSSARVMVRIIEIPPLTPNEVSTQAKKRKEIIHKISTRSNRQNPIKKWDLVSNDDFQNAVARFFRSKKIFYERRQKEWKYRKTELKGVGVSQGPDIRWLSQLIASYCWANPLLGPATAHDSVRELFEDKPYDKIKETTPELAYQLFLLDSQINDSVWYLAQRKSYIDRFKSHAYLTLSSMVVRSLETTAIKWGNPSFTSFLEDTRNNWNHTSRNWNRLVEVAMRYIRAQFDKADKKHRRTEGEPLTPNNFFKSQRHVSAILDAPLPSALKKHARNIVKES